MVGRLGGSPGRHGVPVRLSPDYSDPGSIPGCGPLLHDLPYHPVYFSIKLIKKNYIYIAIYIVVIYKVLQHLFCEFINRRIRNISDVTIYTALFLNSVECNAELTLDGRH